MIRFPSEDWFLALREAAAGDPARYRRLDATDVVLVAKIHSTESTECFEITFSGDRVTSVRYLPGIGSAAPGAVVLEGSFETWREMIESIERNGKADLAHTLNRLTRAGFPMRVRAESEPDIDRFHRYQETLQRFFDEASRFRTDFGDGDRIAAH